MNIDTLLASPLLLACLGALPGCLRAYARASKTNGRARAASDALIGLVFAASIAEWLTPTGYPKLAMANSPWAGSASNSAAAAPAAWPAPPAGATSTTARRSQRAATCHRPAHPSTTRMISHEYRSQRPNPHQVV